MLSVLHPMLIYKLEDNNEGKLSINVYHISSELQSETILLYRRSKITKESYEIDLLKLEDGDNSHYVYIKSCSRFLISNPTIPSRGGDNPPSRLCGAGAGETGETASAAASG